ncbi:MAG: YbaB/EbfC family nucleoid-associated protein, partial [Chlamydiales bacterium]
MMEEKFGKMREEMKQKAVSGSAGNGLVTVTLDGEKALKEIQIRPE